MTDAPYVPHPPHGPDRECPEAVSALDQARAEVATLRARVSKAVATLDALGHIDVRNCPTSIAPYSTCTCGLEALRSILEPLP